MGDEIFGVGTEPEVCGYDSSAGEGFSYQLIQIWDGLVWRWRDIRAIEIPTLEAYYQALEDVYRSTVASLSSWLTLVALIFSPFVQLLGILARAIWPPVRTIGVTAWRTQCALPRHVIVGEIAAIATVLVLIALHRLIARRRYIPRTLTYVRLRREAAGRRYRSFSAGVERKYRLSAKIFPHLAYWAVTILLMWLLPVVAMSLCEWCWEVVMFFWPIMYASYMVLWVRAEVRKSQCSEKHAPGHTKECNGDTLLLKGSRSSVTNDTTYNNNSHGRGGRVKKQLANVVNVQVQREVGPEDVDKVLMYWVVFASCQCSLYLAVSLPFVGTALLRRPPAWSTIAFFFFVWMHLPGQGSGLGVVYAIIEPLVHKYVKNVRPPGGRRAQEQSKSVLHLFVMMRILRETQAQSIIDNVTDSWMLVPTLFFIFSPKFIAYAGCIYAGLAVPTLNSIKALTKGVDAKLSGSEALSTPAGLAKVRWLTYWPAFGIYWYLHSTTVGRTVRALLPLTAHVQLVFLLWMQVPSFRGASRLVDAVEKWLDQLVVPQPLPPPADVVLEDVDGSGLGNREQGTCEVGCDDG
ncbi:unnamed protein product [Choristocarpus tenellus]